MKKRIKFIFYAGAVLLIANSCKKADPLPKPTQEGLNTFGCKIDGKVWIPDGLRGPIPPEKPIAGGFANSSGNTIKIYITTISQNGEVIELFLLNAVIGNNLLNETTIPSGWGGISPKSYGMYFDGIRGNRPFVTSSAHTGKVVITRADTVAKIISGTFEFTAGRGNEKVIITEGRFDINQTTL